MTEEAGARTCGFLERDEEVVDNDSDNAVYGHAEAARSVIGDERVHGIGAYGSTEKGPNSMKYPVSGVNDFGCTSYAVYGHQRYLKAEIGGRYPRKIFEDRCVSGNS